MKTINLLLVCFSIEILDIVVKLLVDCCMFRVFVSDELAQFGPLFFECFSVSQNMQTCKQNDAQNDDCKSRCIHDDHFDDVSIVADE